MEENWIISSEMTAREEPEGETARENLEPRTEELEDQEEPPSRERKKEESSPARTIEPELLQEILFQLWIPAEVKSDQEEPENFLR